jgi:radical SAM protein with 4Fe4S-binding SPASM domain
VPQEVGERHQRLFRQLFGVEAEAWRGFAQDVNGLDTGLLMETVERLRRWPTPFPIGFEPPLRSLAEIPLYYQDPSLLFPDKHCRGPWMWAEIHPNGDLSFCDEYPDYIVGNVLRDGFAEVWNGPQARLFRRQVLAHKRFPICTPCHLLHLGPSPQG